jgi:hypothetical protein
VNVSPTAFRSAVHEQFGRLLSGLGFSVVESAPEVVRFESDAAFVELGHAPYDREVFARIGRFGAPGIIPGESSERLDLSLYLAVKDPEAHLSLCRAVPYACADTEDQVQRVLSYFRAGLNSHGRKLLLADDWEYSFARDLRFWHAPASPSSIDGPATQA